MRGPHNIIRLIREGEGPENLCRGIFNSVVARVVEMGPLGSFIVLTGGVAAAFPIVAQLMAAKTGARVEVPPYSQYVGALGAALRGVPPVRPAPPPGERTARRLSPGARKQCPAICCRGRSAVQAGRQVA